MSFKQHCVLAVWLLCSAMAPKKVRQTCSAMAPKKVRQTGAKQNKKNIAKENVVEGKVIDKNMVAETKSDQNHDIDVQPKNSMKKRPAQKRPEEASRPCVARRQIQDRTATNNRQTCKAKHVLYFDVCCCCFKLFACRRAISTPR